MLRVSRAQLAKYAAAAFTVGLALALTLILRSYLEPASLAFFYGAIAVSAWYGGITSGLFATALSTVAINYLVVPLIHPSASSLVRVVSLGVFMLVTLLISSLSSELKSAKRRAEANLRRHQQTEQDRIRLLEELESKQRLLEAVLQQMPAGLIVAEAPSGHMVLTNERAQQLLFGVRPQAKQVADYLTWVQALHPDGRPYTPEETAMARSLQGEVVTNEETEIVSLAGDRRTVLSNSAPIRDATGQVVAAIVTFYDISERKRTEAALQEQEEQVRLATTAAELGMWFWNLSSDEVTTTEQTNALLEIAPKSRLSYEQFINCLHPDDRSPTHAAVTRALQENTEYDIEYRVVWADSSVHWIAAKGRVFCDADGKPIRMMGTTQDVTKRRQAEAALRQSEEQFRQLAETIQDVFWVWEPNQSQPIYASPAYEQIWGRSCESLYANVPDWYNTLHPEDRDRIRTAFLSQPLDGRYDLEYRIVRPDGSIRWIHDRGFPIYNGAGQVQRIAGVAEDITERRQAEAEREQAEIALRESEARFRYMANAAPVMMWMSDTDKLCYYFNQPWLNFTGRTAEQEMGYGWAENLHSDDAQRCLDRYTTAFEARQEFSIEYRLKRFDGEYRWMLDHGVPRYTQEGCFLGYIGSCIDVTDRKRIEEEREQLLAREQTAREAAVRAAARSAEANRIKDEFLAVLSHELRSPLNPILGWTKLLRSRSFDAAATDRALETIERNAKLQAQLVEDLLDVSRILRGKLSLSVSPVNLAATIEAALETVWLSAEAKAITIHKQFDPKVGLVAGDAGRLQQVVWNLLSNAIKFTSTAGQISICLAKVVPQQPDQQLSTDHPDIAYAEITVTDTGKGISPDFLPYVFDAFRQADSSTTRQFGGLGLGLAIVRHIIELHGGTVSVNSLGEGKGATFIVRLPLSKDDSTSITDVTVDPSPMSQLY